MKFIKTGDFIFNANSVIKIEIKNNVIITYDDANKHTTSNELQDAGSVFEEIAKVLNNDFIKIINFLVKKELVRKIQKNPRSFTIFYGDKHSTTNEIDGIDGIFKKLTDEIVTKPMTVTSSRSI